MSDTIKRATEIPSIDVNLITVKKKTSEDTTEYILDTASKLGVETVLNEVDAVQLVVKGKLKAQKPKTSTLTGHTLTLTDNVFTPELVKMLQGGTITTDPQTGKITKYTPPVAGSDEKGEVLILSAYSAVYNAAGQIVEYEKITYPNCTGVPIAFQSEDGVFRTPEYTINSAPDNGEAPYEIEYVSSLPTPTPSPGE